MAVSSLALLALVALLGNVQCQFPGRERDNTLDECVGKVMDIFFVLDSSTSIYVNHFRQEHQFVRDVVSRFDIGDRTTRVGALTFSDDFTRPVLGLNRFQSKQDVIASITEQNLPYRTGITNTHLALRYVRENPEFRQDITKVMVVVTDGGSRSPGSTAREAELAREQGFYLFVVGIGQYLEQREWSAIASNPDEDFIFNITNFRFLDTIKFTLPSRICPLPPIIVGSCDVVQRGNLMFVAPPGSTRDAIAVIDKFNEETQDPARQLRISYVMDVCQNAENVAVGDVGIYCNRFANAAETTSDSYRELLAQARSIARNNRPDTAARQVAVIFLERQVDRFAIRTEIQYLTQFGVEVIIVNLGSSDQGNYFRNILRNRDNVIQMQPGFPISQQNTQARLFMERTCDALSRGSGGLGPFNPV